jgi:hypothetical protein
VCREVTQQKSRTICNSCTFGFRLVNFLMNSVVVQKQQRTAHRYLRVLLVQISQQLSLIVLQMHTPR